MCDRVEVVVNTASAELAEQVRSRLEDFPVELICDPKECDQAPLCRWLDPQSLNDDGQLMSAVLDAIETLEATRHAFRSKQLGSLRRRLEKLLRELPAGDT